LRSYQRRAGVTQRRDHDSGASSSSAASDVGPRPAYQHDRKSRSVSPASQTDSYRSSTTSSTVHTPTVEDSVSHSPVQTPSSPTPADWPRFYVTTISPRHVTEYKYCVTVEPEEIRPSRRCRENTHTKLFGADEPDSPRSAAVADSAATGGLKTKPVPARRPENTQTTLFGPPDPHRKSSRAHPDTYHSLFGPPTSHPQRRSRSCFHDTADLLHHDSSAGGRAGEDLEAVRGRYALRHEDTGIKLFGDAIPAPSQPTSTPKPYADHDIFLVGNESAANRIPTITIAAPCADPVPLP